MTIPELLDKWKQEARDLTSQARKLLLYSDKSDAVKAEKLLIEAQAKLDCANDLLNNL